jgi:hypothetical protein
MPFPLSLYDARVLIADDALMRSRGRAPE